MIDETTPEYRILSLLLEENEKVWVEVVERRLGGGRLWDPTHAYATSKRIIMVRGGVVLGVAQDFRIIQYGSITQIKLEHGIRFCKLHFSLQGESPDDAAKKWLVGLEYREAMDLVRFVNKMEAKPIEEKKVT